MTCPVCQTVTDPAPETVAGVTICPACLRSLVLNGDTARIAMASDTTVLSPEQLAALRAMRKQYRQANV